MKVQNSPSFCGRVYNPDNIEGIGHILTGKVRDVMAAAPEVTGLHFEKGVSPDSVSIGFTIPGNQSEIGVNGFIAPVDGKACINGMSGAKADFQEEFVLDMIRKGLAYFNLLN